MIGPKQVKEDVTAQVVRGCWMLPPSIANQPPSVQLSTRQPVNPPFFQILHGVAGNRSISE